MANFNQNFLSAFINQMNRAQQNRQFQSQLEQEKNLNLLRTVAESVASGIGDPAQANVLIGSLFPELVKEKKTVVPAQVQAKDLPIAAPKEVPMPRLRPTALNQSQYEQNLGREAIAALSRQQVPDRFRGLGQASTPLPAELRATGQLPSPSELVPKTRTEKVMPQLFRERPEKKESVLKSAADLSQFATDLFRNGASNEDVQKVIQENFGVTLSLPSVDDFRNKKLEGAAQDIATAKALESERLAMEKYNLARAAHERMQKQVTEKKTAGGKIDSTELIQWRTLTSNLLAGANTGIRDLNKQIADVEKGRSRIGITPEEITRINSDASELKKQRAELMADKLVYELSNQYIGKLAKDVDTKPSPAQVEMTRRRLEKLYEEAGFSEDDIVDAVERKMDEAYPEKPASAKKSIGW